MLKIYSYVLDHDLGLAPNPFHGFCTLAVCKPQIRKSNNLNIGDWIVGTGSKSLEVQTGKKFVGKLIYAMRVNEIISFQDYWEDSRFQRKKPNVNGTIISMYGDNIYHMINGEWIQENSAHSTIEGDVNIKHLKKDLGGKRVLVSQDFYYFGDSAPILPNNLKDICHDSIGQKIVSANLNDDFINWLTSNFQVGIRGDPANWFSYQQLKLFN
ncbi:hypothetical protein GOQ04_20395 [Emticicia sp. ODNR4P]|nr:hypothetical protein [Emticicia sp. ODNR4P]